VSDDLKKMKFYRHNLFFENNPWKWDDTYEQAIHFADFFAKHMEGSSVLLVGTGPTDAQYYDWPQLMEKFGASSVEYLEVFQGNIDFHAGKPYKIKLGDGREIDKYYSNDSIDLVFFLHGPEHISKEDMLPMFDKCFDVCKKAVLFACPYGGYYDGQGEMGGNIHEDHIQKNMREDTFDSSFDNYEIFYFDKEREHSGESVIIIQREKDEKI
jgi:hypothetical protein